MDEKLKKICPNCSQLYNLRSLTPVLRGNIPLFLKCGHSMCESCIRNIVKFAEPIECKVCHNDMEVKSSDVALSSLNKSLLYQVFPVNVFLLGELTLQFMEDNSQTQNGKHEDYYIDLQKIIQSVDSTKGQCLECHIPTTKMCKQCATILCDTCFNKTHKNFVVFKNHVLTNIEEVMEPNHCKVHKDKPLDYYCNDCSKSICMDCLMVGGEKSCKDHNVVSMQEVNAKFYEDINQISPKVDETYKRLTKTAVDIGNILHNMENDTGATCELTNIIADIEQHFSKLTSKIQSHKKEVIDIILTLKSAEKDSLRKAKNDVSNALKNAKKVLNTINCSSDPEKQKQINLSVLLESAKEIINAPWYLSKDENSNDPLKVAVNEDLCALITDYIHLEGNVKSVYKLQSTLELGADVEIPPAPTAPVYPPELPKDVRQQKKKKPADTEENRSNATRDYKPGFSMNAPKYRSKSGSVSSLNSCDSESSYKSYITRNEPNRPIVQHVQPFEESRHPKPIYEGSQELIYITHIVDPHNFFVQRSCHQRLVKDMIREFRNANSMPKPSVNHITEGKVYLVFNKADNMWQRCRVMRIDRKNQSQIQVQVFCFDFGSIEFVGIDKLRLLPPARLQDPSPLALNCSLANCVPKTGRWTSDDSILIQNIIDNKQAVMHVRHIRSNECMVTYECDVTTFEDSVSVAHALVFHDRAKLINPRLPYPSPTNIMDRPKIFMSNNDFKPKSIEEAYITHIVSPDKFYVRKRHLQSIYEKLCEDLDQEYSLGVNNGSIYLPEIGMVCVVNTDKYRAEQPELSSWERAIVMELPGRGRARLLLPDCGASLLAHWGSLRRIHRHFTAAKALATECYLAGVTPLNKKWSTGSVALLRKYQERLLELHVDDTRARAVGVTLYDKTDVEDVICINNEMIKHKFAVTFGLFKFNKNDAQDQVITNKSPLDPPKQYRKPKPEVTILKKQSSPKKKIKEQDLEAKDKGPLRLEAKLLHYQSPSLLYISLLHQNKLFHDLYEKIQKYYTTTKTQGKSEWAVGDRCCTICAQSQTWRRAVIVEFEKDNAKIFYSDFACIETVPTASLKELPNEFAAVGDAAIKCHLCGVIPAVGDEWPSLTKEYLKELLDAYKRIFITKLGSFKNKSMPIEIWVYHTTQGGALEPNKSEWRCLNKKIIEQGLGIPDKVQEVTSPENLGSDDEMLSFLNITGSVNEWLQLESMPIKPLLKDDSESVSDTPSPNVLDEVTDEMNEFLKNADTVFISDWLPAEKLPNKEFTGMPTYIDNDGVIYLHDVCQQDTLDLIRKALDIRFKNPDPRAKFVKWSVGEPCVALYYLDKRFYRGRILEVCDDISSCVVQYIDYGNEETCSYEDLRKSIALYQIPIQAHKCVLSRIKPVDDHWNRQILDYIHKFMVEKKCLIKVSGETDGDVTPIELKYDKLWLNDHLVEFEMAVYTDGSKACVRKYAPPTVDKLAEEAIESDSGPDYIVEESTETGPMSTSADSIDVRAMRGKDWNKLLDDDDDEDEIEEKFTTYPKFDKTEFLCNVTIINDTKTMELNIIHDDETNLIYEEMFRKLQEQGENMSPLNGIFENKACVALFHEDAQWYRASILQHSEEKNLIKVRYVDYGNIEIISLADAREITDDFSHLPPASIQVKIHGVELNQDLEIDLISKEFASTFLEKGPFTAKVINYIDPYPIVELRNDANELVYESLISKGVFLKSDIVNSDA
ncbi:uncharacterized protein LOC114360174 [Ostrinia furnacalis]|uniref:uncharacterized protein LOC114360174 n=1 Tax=Ostrinia furnacalis TaxID=93504 RepID=UPI00103863F4|nr:uncharacterized protein LOC114360174 [Ostrinia furnacalis]